MQVLWYLFYLDPFPSISLQITFNITRYNNRQKEAVPALHTRILSLTTHDVFNLCAIHMNAIS